MPRCLLFRFYGIISIFITLFLKAIDFHSDLITDIFIFNSFIALLFNILVENS